MEKPIKPGQRVIVALRKMIAAGELVDGERIAEIPTAAKLGVSRMPVRTALRALEQEGLVVRLGARGYAARGPTASQITGAVEVRGVLEGLAARLIAGRPIDPSWRKRVRQCLDVGDSVFAKGHLADEDMEKFYAYNLAFHDLIVSESDNQAIGAALARNNHLPFASAAALALDWNDRATEYQHLLRAHDQHHAVTYAILTGNGVLAEQLMRQHAQASVGSATIFERFGIESLF